MTKNISDFSCEKRGTGTVSKFKGMGGGGAWQKIAGGVFEGGLIP